MKVQALVPVQDFARAKSRLAASLAPGAREALARRMAAHVLDTLASCAAIDTLAVVTPSKDVHAWARARGHRALYDAEGARGLGAIVDAALRALPEGPALVVMSDLPLLSAGDVGAIVGASASADVVIGCDGAGRGTNVLLLRSPMPSCFGHEDSALRHRARALELGLRVETIARRGIEHDVDLPEHLAEMDALLASPRGLALS